MELGTREPGEDAYLQVAFPDLIYKSTNIELLTAMALAVAIGSKFRRQVVVNDSQLLVLAL